MKNFLGNAQEFFNWLITDTTGLLCLAGAGAFLLLLLVIIITVAVKKKRKAKKLQEAQVQKEIAADKAMRYTDTTEIKTETGDVKISYNKGDIVIGQNEKTIAKKGGKVSPGKYTILTSAESKEKINIRKGTYVREFAHGEEIILAEGEEITPVSGSIILR